jgi:hypothetical protein
MSDGVRRGRFARSIMIAQVMSGRADGESVFGMVEDDEGY